jgi:hypothetical protein
MSSISSLVFLFILGARAIFAHHVPPFPLCVSILEQIKAAPRVIVAFNVLCGARARHELAEYGRQQLWRQ